LCEAAGVNIAAVHHIVFQAKLSHAHTALQGAVQPEWESDELASTPIILRPVFVCLSGERGGLGWGGAPEQVLEQGQGTIHKATDKLGAFASHARISAELRNFRCGYIDITAGWQKIRLMYLMD
jgi:hypothetical protein